MSSVRAHQNCWLDKKMGRWFLYIDKSPNKRDVFCEIIYHTFKKDSTRRDEDKPWELVHKKKSVRFRVLVSAKIYAEECFKNKFISS